jgi:hypothetical protein
MLLNSIEDLTTKLLQLASPVTATIGWFTKLSDLMPDWAKKIMPDTMGPLPFVPKGLQDDLMNRLGKVGQWITGSEPDGQHSQVADAQQAVKDNIEALKANTEALKASMGKDDGMMLAGDFMRGVVNADSGFRVKQRALPQGKHHGTPTRGPMHAHAAANAHPGAKQGLPPPRVGPPAGHAMAWEAGADEG